MKTTLHNSLQQKTLRSSAASKLWYEKKGLLTAYTPHLWGLPLAENLVSGGLTSW